MATKKAPAKQTDSLDALLKSGIRYASDEPIAEQAPVSQEGAGIFRTMGDMAVKGAQGVVDLGASAVGLGNLVTGGLVGQGMDAMGYDPQRTNLLMGQYLSGSQKDADARVQNAQGFVGTLAQAVQEPRFIAGSVMQSLPGMLGIGAAQKVAAGAIAAKAALATAEGAAASAGLTGAKAIEAALATAEGSKAAQAAVDAAAGRLMALSAANEGAQTAGNIAQDAQHAGRNWSDYALPALAAGAGTAAIGYGAGKLMGDAGTGIFTGADTHLGESLGKRVLKSGFSEGVLEEMPQSAQERYFTNLANGESDPMKGVASDAAVGLVTGGAMGIGMGGFHGAPHAPQETAVQPDPMIPPAPPAGPMTRAVSSLVPTNMPTQPVGTMGTMKNGVAGPGFDASILPTFSTPQEEIAFHNASPEDQAAYLAAQQDTADKPITHGPIAEAKLSEEDKRAMLYSNQPVVDGGLQYEGTQDGDVLNGMGAPFKTKFAALRRAQMEGKDWTIAPVFDGWVARRKDTDGATVPTQPGTGTGVPIASDHTGSGVAAGNVSDVRSGTDQVRAPVADVGVPFGDATGTNDSALTYEQFKGQMQSLLNESFKYTPNQVGGSVFAEKMAELSDQYPEFSAKLDQESANVKDTAQGTVSEATQAQGKEAPSVGSDEPATGVPAAGSATVESAGVAPAWQTTKKDYIANLQKNAHVPLQGGVVDGSAYYGQMHRDIVEDALNRGESVPAKVLKDYPDLVAKSTTASSGASAPSVVTQQVSQPAQLGTTGKGSGASQTTQAAPLVEHTTAKGKVLRGVVRTDLTKDQAFAIDKYSFKKDGGYFIREEHLSKLPPVASEPSAPEAGQDEYGPRWNRMTTIEREATAQLSGLQKVPAGNVAKRGWQALDPVVQDRMKKGMDKSLGGSDVKPAQAADIQPAAPVQAVSDWNPDAAKQSMTRDQFIDAAVAHIKAKREASGKKAFSGVMGDTEIDFRLNAGFAWDEANKGKDAQASTSVESAKKLTPNQRIAENLKARADYFTPGNIVQGYSGHDRVISYQAPDGKGEGWNVTVQSVVKQGDQWVVDPKDTRVRTHSTMPDTKALKAGPVERVETVEAAAPTNVSIKQENIATVEKPVDDIAKQSNAEFIKALETARKNLPEGYEIQPEGNTVALKENGKFAVTGLGRNAAGVQEALRQAKLRATQKSNPAEDAPAKQLGEQLTELNAALERQGAVQNADTRAKRDQIRLQIAEQDFPEILKAVDDSINVAEDLNRAFKYAGDEPKAKTIERILKKHGITSDYQKRWTERLLAQDGQNDELDAEMRSYEAKAENKPSESGSFGPILTQFKHDAQGAIKALTKLKDGEAVAALYHQEVGDIDLVWGRPQSGKQEGFGLAKISEKHPEVMGDLQGFLNGLHKDKDHSGANRIRLINETGDAVVSLDWKGEQKAWLLTAYKKGAEAGTTMDTASNGLKDDTARLEPGPDQSVLQPKTEINSPTVSANTIFTEDAAAAARARLKAKLGRLSSGIDPEMLMDGITLAGYHIERGARTFAAYAKAMMEDLGDGVKPFLKSWYMGAKYDPRTAGFDGLDSAATVDGFDVDALATEAEKADTDTKDTKNDPTPATPTPTLDSPVAEGQRPAGSEAPARGAQRTRPGEGRGNDGSVRRDGQLRADANNDQSRVANGYGRTDSGSTNEATGNVAGGLQRVSADFIPSVGGLTRKGSWFDTAKRNIDLIELAIKIESENRAATPEEQEQLSKYVGFGASAIRNELFPVPPSYAKAQEPNRLIWPQYVRNDRFKPLAERIEALPREWQETILQSSQYAHYTSEGIIRSVWSALQRMGFMGGNIFEPGMGIGSFAMLMPNTIRNTSRYTGVEFDGPTALIARLLSPEQNMIHGDFIKKRFPKNFFDVNVGNPPFSQTKIFGDPEYAKNGFMLHDFFFAKGIDLVRPGGIQVFVTSKGTMDKLSDKARKYLSDRADLLGAIRLPSTAFEDNAGTSVVTDVIFLRKRADGEPAGGKAWGKIVQVDTKDGPVMVNEYYAKHPEMVLGQQRISGNTDDMGRRINSNGMGGEKYTVVSYDTTPEELDAKFAQAIEKLPENVYSVMGQSSQAIKDATAKIDFDPSVKREGVVYLSDDGTLMRVEQGVGKPLDGMVKLSDKEQTWLKDYVGLRDLVQQARFDQLNDGDWQSSLAKLNQAHDAFVKKHGHIRDFRVITRKSTDEDGNVVTSEIRVSKNKRLLSEDYDRALVTALEDITEDGTIVKAPMLKGRTIGKPVTRDVKTIGDALAVSMDERGTLDLDDVAQRMKMNFDEVVDALGTQVYQTPTGEWQLADEYLSGDVVSKLEQAEQAARLNPALQRNVEALKAAQPEKLGPSQISAKLGASWIPESHVNEFAKEIGAGLVTFDPKTESWHVQGGNERSARRAGEEYGTAKRSPSELLEAILNSRSIKVTATVDKKVVTDAEATASANEMAKKIKDKFKGWVWTDTTRASELVEVYNRHFNNIAPRRFDGSHLTLPGVSLRYKLHPHQLRAIWRMIQTGNTYLAHAVGAGKTIEMIAGGMEQKRLGLIKKPMYVVPNHMLEQFSNEFMELYPLANIMVADDENFSADRRKAFVASATLNNPDAIIITHDAFQRIGVKEESVAPIRDEILADLEIELSETANNNDGRVRRGQLQQQIEAVTQRFDKIIGAGQKDSTIKFEDMGVDFVFADEAHTFRKLDFHTAQSIKGIDPNGSKRALDMYVKTRILEKNRPGRAFTFASGTPVTNTMGELYTIMRFFAADELDKAGISTFDAWARQFGEVVAALEPNAAGAYQIVERFAKFDNVPELMSRVRQFMDVLTSDNLGALVKRPDMAGGKPNLNIIPANEALTEYMKGELARRIEVSKAWKPSPGEKGNPDPIVSIITDGRFAAIDPRFFGGKLQDGETSIIMEMGDKVVKNYHATKDNVYTDKDGKPEPIKGSTQIVFYNLGFGEGAQRARNFDARTAFTKRLTDGGIPRNEIYWFDDANTDAKKEAVFKDMRSGKLKVLIGSAKKMGTGVNVQKRLAVLHYQDPPWFPADVEQPHGRIIRQGNQNATVAIEWYTTKGTYQSTMWQMVGRKQRFIDQAFTGDKTMRSMDDLGEASLFEQAAAVASGDPRAIQLAGLKQDVERFERLQAAHHSEQISVRVNLDSAKWHVDSLQKRIAQLSKAFKAIDERYFSFTAGRVGNTDFTKVGEFGQAVKDAFNKEATASLTNSMRIIGKQIASLGDGILVKMDSSIGKDNKPDGKFDLYVEFGGMTFQVGNTSAMGADVDAVGLARRIVNQINSVSSDLTEARRNLVDEETDVTKLSKKLGAPFEHQQELAEKYGELKRLEAELKAEGEAQPDVPLVINVDGEIGVTPLRNTAAFSQGAGPGISEGELAQVVDDFLAKFGHQAPVVVADSAKGVLPGVADTDKISGAVHRGRVYLFLDQIPNRTEAIKSLWHETLHYGLRRFLTKDQFIKEMLDLYKNDMWVRNYANKWFNSSEGQAAIKFGGILYARARGVDEALANLSEQTQGGQESSRFTAKVFRSVADWLARMADRMGYPTMAAFFRGMSNTEAKAYVRSVFQKLKDDAPATSRDWAFTADPAFKITDTLNNAANSVRDVKLPAGYLVGDLINAAPNTLHWWHKSVGTQYHLAQKSPEFKRVFDAVQTFLNDTSYFATEAADLAPNILPKLEDLKDIARSPLSPEDTQRFSRAVFEGTLIWGRDESGKLVRQEDREAAAADLSVDQKSQRLLRNDHISEQVLKMWRGLPIDQYEAMINAKYERDMLKPGVVFTDAELKQQFGLNPKQISLYREFRKATDKSLTNLAIADMLRFGGKDVEPIRETALASTDATEAANLLADYLRSLAESDPERSTVLMDTSNKMIDKGRRAADLIARGYAPLSRFGKYTLDVVNEGGERVYFGMFESKMDAAKMARHMRQEYPKATISQGTVSEQAYKLFSGVSPETLELFGDMLGLEAQGDSASAQAFQEYLKLAKSNRSAMKRLIQRKGIAGFNEDAGRVLAGFVYSNARQTSNSLHAGEMSNAVNDIPARQGEVKDAAVKLYDYIKNPQEEAQAIRGLMFTQYIGGSIASAMVNLTQPLTMTMPWLAQYGGIQKAAKQMAAAVKDANKSKTGDAKLDAALKLAEEKGIVSPQEVHQLMKQAQGNGALRSGDGTALGNASAKAHNALSKLMLAWGKPFSWAEQMNRKVTFIAAYRTAVEQKMADPAGFAERAIEETQGIYNRGNKPAWARGALGSTLFTFKQYSIAYVEMLQRMASSGPEGKKAALFALAIMFLLSGASGLPGSDDLDDIISGALQHMGYNFDSKQKRREFFVKLVGDGGADFLERGLSGLPGVPIDVSGRLGIGNLIPATGMLVKKPDHTRDLAELAGPAGDMAKRGYEAAVKLIGGDISGPHGAIATAAPKAMQNLFQAYDMANRGMYRDQNGRKVLDTNLGDAISKAIGFQPNDVKKVQDASFDVQRMIGLNKMRESEIVDQWAKGLFDKDPEAVKNARDELAQWNKDNPESPIRIKLPQVLQKVRNMRMTKTERMVKTAPREIRASVRQELEAAR